MSNNTKTKLLTKFDMASLEEKLKMLEAWKVHRHVQVEELLEAQNLVNYMERGIKAEQQMPPDLGVRVTDGIGADDVVR